VSAQSTGPSHLSGRQVIVAQRPAQRPGSLPRRDILILPNRAERFTPETIMSSSAPRPPGWTEAITAAISAAPKPSATLIENVAGLLAPALAAHLKAKSTDATSKSRPRRPR
jgi:hypothetical protein